MPNYSESLPELFERVGKEKSRKRKIEMLQAYQNQQTLQTILQGTYHPDRVWALPEGAPPYKKEDNPYGTTPSVLDREIRKLPYLLQGHPRMAANRTKRESIFIDMLEVMHPSESELLIQMKDGKIDCNGMTQKLVAEAFPGLVPMPEKGSGKK